LNASTPAAGALRRPLATFGAALFVLSLALPLPRSEALSQQPAPEALILLSFRIRPYESLARSMAGALPGYRTRVLSLEEIPSLEQELGADRPAVICTVGQEALRKALPHRDGTPVVYTMVLSTGGLLPPETAGVEGVAMVPSPRHQLRVLGEGFHFRRVLLLYNPASSGFLVDLFRESAPGGLECVTEAIGSEAALLRRLKEGLKGFDALLLVPDPTLLSEQGLKALVSASYQDGVPLVGFSPLYLGLGAAVTLSVPEAEVARQAAALARDGRGAEADRLGGLTYTRACEIRLNPKAVARLGLRVDSQALERFGGVREGEP